jgi:hypothetical protein
VGEGLDAWQLRQPFQQPQDVPPLGRRKLVQLLEMAGRQDRRDRTDAKVPTEPGLHERAQALVADRMPCAWPEIRQ